MFGGTYNPINWTTPKGQLLDIKSNIEIFDIIGSLYGGNGMQTFGLPLLEQVDGVDYTMNLKGSYPEKDDDYEPARGTVGEIILWAAEFVPYNWAKCDGQSLKISQANHLYKVIGGTFGQDSSDTFNVPKIPPPGKHLMYIINVNGLWPAGGDGSIMQLSGTVGCIEWWPGKTSQIASEWFPCDGRSLLQVDYRDLFSVITAQFGGSKTKFNLPNITAPAKGINPVICFKGVYPERE